MPGVLYPWEKQKTTQTNKHLDILGMLVIHVTVSAHVVHHQRPQGQQGETSDATAIMTSTTMMLQASCPPLQTAATSTTTTTAIGHAGYRAYLTGSQFSSCTMMPPTQMESCPLPTTTTSTTTTTTTGEENVYYRLALAASLYRKG